MFYCLFIEQISFVTKGRSLKDEHDNVSGGKQQGFFENLCKEICLTISSVLQNNLSLIEQSCNTMTDNQNIEYLKESVKRGLWYLVQCTNIPEDELFKICLDFWHFFSYDIL